MGRHRCEKLPYIIHRTAWHRLSISDAKGTRRIHRFSISYQVTTFSFLLAVVISAYLYHVTNVNSFLNHAYATQVHSQSEIAEATHIMQMPYQNEPSRYFRTAPNSADSIHTMNNVFPTPPLYSNVKNPLQPSPYVSPITRQTSIAAHPIQSKPQIVIPPQDGQTSFTPPPNQLLPQVLPDGTFNSAVPAIDARSQTSPTSVQATDAGSQVTNTNVTISCGWCFDKDCCWPRWFGSIITLYCYAVIAFITCCIMAKHYEKGLFCRAFYREGGIWLMTSLLLGAALGIVLGIFLSHSSTLTIVASGAMMSFFMSFILLGFLGAIVGGLGGLGMGIVIGFLIQTSWISVGAGAATGFLAGVVVGFAPIFRSLEMNKRYVRGGFRSSFSEQSLNRQKYSYPKRSVSSPVLQIVKNSENESDDGSTHSPAFDIFFSKTKKKQMKAKKYTDSD